MLVIPEGFIEWFQGFCERKIFVRVFLTPNDNPDDTSAIKAVEIIARWLTGDDWLRFVLYTHRSERGGGMWYRPMCTIYSLQTLLMHWQEGGVWSDECFKQSQLVAVLSRGLRRIRVPIHHPRIIATLGEVIGYLGGPSASPEVVPAAVAHLNGRLQGLYNEMLATVERVIPLTAEDV